MYPRWVVAPQKKTFRRVHCVIQLAIDFNTSITNIKKNGIVMLEVSLYHCARRVRFTVLVFKVFYLERNAFAFRGNRFYTYLALYLNIFLFTETSFEP
jgi:hypothetical protein